MKELQQYKHVHFIGIGGAGMSAIARVLLEKGFSVSGSDLSGNEITQKLARGGARIDVGHAAENVHGADLIVTSTAIGRENPERRAAEDLGIPIWRRAHVLAEIMRGGKSIAIAGTHGKTTTTSMLALMLYYAEFDPTILIGGELNDIGGNARTGQGEWVVAEADESDASFLDMNPDRIIVTNIEADHLDFYSGLDHIKETFIQFFSQLQPGGKIIGCIDCPTVAELFQQAGQPVITYALNPAAGARMTARDIELTPSGAGTRFVPVWDGQPLAPVTLKVPGRHNVANALAALCCGLDIGVPYPAMVRALAVYQGVKRRFQIKGIEGGVTIVDDYAHHPTEIAATLSAARSQVQQRQTGRLVGVFQPHRFSRTQKLAHDFGLALLNTDLVVITDVYSAGEKQIDGVSGQLIYDLLVRNGHLNAHYIPSLDDTRAFFAQQLEPNDLFLTIGAGSIYKVGEALLEDLRLREKAPA